MKYSHIPGGYTQVLSKRLFVIKSHEGSKNLCLGDKN